jgi:hypothetical protein
MKTRYLSSLVIIIFLFSAVGLRADDSFTIDADLVMQAIPGDSTAFFEVALVNTGDSRDSYAITLVNDIPDLWISVLCIDSICLPGDSGMVTLNPGAISMIKPDIIPMMDPGDGEITVVVKSINDPGNIQQMALRAVSGYRTLLLGNSLSEDQYRSYYEDALISAGVDFNYWDRCFSEFRYEDLINFDFMVIYTGNRASDLFTYGEISALDNYLDSGGNLLISGQGLASSLQGTNFLETTLGVNYTGDHSGILSVDGVAGDPIGGGLQFDIAGGDGANNQIAPDDIDTLNGSQAVFVYDSGELSGVRLDRNGYRTVFFAFGFEAVDNGLDRNEVISRSFDWFGYTTSIVQEGFPTAPGVFEIMSIYPNPFNASTTINYRLYKPSAISLDIFDELGRKIENIFNGSVSAGEHRVVWDAGDMPSGLYFFNINASGSCKTIKMLLVK